MGPRNPAWKRIREKMVCPTSAQNSALQWLPEEHMTPDRSLSMDTSVLLMAALSNSRQMWTMGSGVKGKE